MKKLLFLLLIPFCFSCEESNETASPEPDFITAESIDAFDCVNDQADNPPALADAQKWIVGKWQLKGVISMIPNPEIPNYQVEFMEDGTVIVTKAGERVYTDAYSVIDSKEGDYQYLEIITDSFEIVDGLNSNFNEHNIVEGTLRICEKEMMVDQGIAFDAPGYLFRKIEE